MTPTEIKQARKSLGLTQGQLAALMDIRQATISDWETGKHSPEGPPARLMQAYIDGYRPANWPT